LTHRMILIGSPATINWFILAIYTIGSWLFLELILDYYMVHHIRRAGKTEHALFFGASREVAAQHTSYVDLLSH